MDERKMKDLGAFLPKGRGPLNTQATRIPGGVFVGITMSDKVYQIVVESEEAGLEKLNKVLGGEISSVVKKLAMTEADIILGKE